MNYQIENGMYCLYKGEERLTKFGELEEVALMFDAKDGVLHKHGHEAMVLESLQLAKQRLQSANLPLAQRMAEDLQVICGRFPIDELNKCLSTSGYVKTLHEKMLNDELTPEPLPESCMQRQSAPSRMRLS